MFLFRTVDGDNCSLNRDFWIADRSNHFLLMLVHSDASDMEPPQTFERELEADILNKGTGGKW